MTNDPTPPYVAYPATERAELYEMPDFHEISYRGRTIAALAGEQILVAPAPAEQLPFVKAACAYAIEVLDGTVPGPYSDQGAEGYAAYALPPAGARGPGV